MALRPSTLPVEPTLTLYTGQEEQSPAMWAAQTSAFQQLWRTYADQGILKQCVL